MFDNHKAVMVGNDDDGDDDVVGDYRRILFYFKFLTIYS